LLPDSSHYLTYGIQLSIHSFDKKNLLRTYVEPGNVVEARINFVRGCDKVADSGRRCRAVSTVEVGAMVGLMMLVILVVVTVTAVVLCWCDEAGSAMVILHTGKVKK
jgi:hypothetical protein